VSKKDKVYQKIRDAIITEGLNPGERLIESQLCQQYGVSRGPIRETLIQLNREGFVSLVPNKGAIVTKLSIQDLKNYFDLIAVLECKAVEWAIPNIKAADIENLIEIQEELKKIFPVNREKAIMIWGQLNYRFHQLFWEKSDNVALVEEIQLIRKKILRYRFLSLVMNSFKDFLKDHEKIITATTKQNIKKASNVMHAHIMRDKDLVVQHLTDISG
jgi:DNA-binding GntR family transcriptional regulator